MPKILVWCLLFFCVSLSACSSSSSDIDQGPVHPLAPPVPLETSGRFIVDADGERVKLASINWYGASDKLHIVGGLDHAHIDDIVRSIRALGMNSVRLPFSNEMMTITTPIDPKYVSANPQLVGLTPLEIFDETIDALSREGILIILNNHTSTGMWCCGVDSDGLWFTRRFSEERWIEDWKTIVKRYRNKRYVVGADLRNEVRINPSPGFGTPHWADPTKPKKLDWHAAAQRAGNEVLKVNPNILIVVEGVNFPRDHLSRVAEFPIVLDRPNRLVYAAHNYAFTSPEGITGTLYRNMDWETFSAKMDEEWGYVVEEDQPYTAPVWVSEFGVGFDPDEEEDRTWFTNIMRYLEEGDFDFAYWPLNPGPKASGHDEPYGLLELDWVTPRDDFRTRALRDIAAPTTGPGVDR